MVVFNISSQESPFYRSEKVDVETHLKHHNLKTHHQRGANVLDSYWWPRKSLLIVRALSLPNNNGGRSWPSRAAVDTLRHGHDAVRSRCGTLVRRQSLGNQVHLVSFAKLCVLGALASSRSVGVGGRGGRGDAMETLGPTLCGTAVTLIASHPKNCSLWSTLIAQGSLQRRGVHRGQGGIATHTACRCRRCPALRTAKALGFACDAQGTTSHRLVWFNTQVTKFWSP